jgi:ABC-type transporter Mla subunit MlaD
MALKTAYELNIPSGSTVSLETAGVLGETFVEIDTHNASGPPIRSGGTLKAQPIANLTSEQMIEKFAAAFNLSNSEAVEKLEALIKARCDGGKDQSEAVSKRPATQARHTN